MLGTAGSSQATWGSEAVRLNSSGRKNHRGMKVCVLFGVVGDSELLDLYFREDALEPPDCTGRTATGRGQVGAPGMLSGGMTTSG